METGAKILIVEDDADISMVEEAYLKAAGYQTEVVSDGNLVRQKVEKQPYDLILLDLMLPGKSGYDICAEIRDNVDIPILMVTAKTESIDKIKGFGTGADDYIEKPFDPSELVARVHANLRQYARLKKKDPTEENRKIIVGDVAIFLDSWQVKKGNRECKLPNKEFELLAFLAQNPNIVFSKEQLFEKIWGYDYVGDGATVMVHINRIREKIEDDCKNPKIIETVWGPVTDLMQRCESLENV